MAGKRVKPDDVERIVAPIVEAIGTLRTEFGGLREEFGALRTEMHDGFRTMNRRLRRVERNTADTADAVRRLERGATGVGRTTALEKRVARLEKHVGIEPQR